MSWKHVHSGSTRELFSDGRGHLQMNHTPYVSVFDVGRYPNPITGFDVSRCDFFDTAFRMFEDQGIPTHFVGRINETTIEVEEYACPSVVKEGDVGVVYPIEFITRHVVAGSLLRRLMKGEEDFREYGFDFMPPYGTTLPCSVYELWTKREGTDRLITEDEAIGKLGMTAKAIEACWDIVRAVDEALCFGLHYRYDVFDFKVECASNARGIALLAYGISPDECRIVSKASAAKGRFDHYDKEYLRAVFIECGYYDLVTQARKEGRPLPPYPILEAGVIDEVARRYRVVTDHLMTCS